MPRIDEYEGRVLLSCPRTGDSRLFWSSTSSDGGIGWHGWEMVRWIVYFLLMILFSQLHIMLCHSINGYSSAFLSIRLLIDKLDLDTIYFHLQIQCKLRTNNKQCLVPHTNWNPQLPFSGAEEIIMKWIVIAMCNLWDSIGII